MKKKKLTEINEWIKLKNHYKRIKRFHLRDLFSLDKRRSEKFNIYDRDIYFDYSKNIINKKTLELLLELAKARNLKNEIDRMFKGEKINRTENQPVLHTALRNLSNTPINIDNKDIMPKVLTIHKKMKKISEKIRIGEWRGFSGKKIKYIIHVGIGGSYLGTQMVCETLKYYSQRDLKIFFISNIDGTNIIETLKKINIEETLFIIASKTFTTLETITNAQTAKEMILSHFKSKKSISKHFLAISANKKAVTDFGIDKDNILELWDWVGGRYSLTSAIGLPIMISIGYSNFIELLNGFFEMDNHFKNTPFEKNIPVIMALLGIWYNNFFKAETHAILPYSQYLYHLPSYIQELDMESNGKSVNKEGENFNYQTGPIIWGGLGTNGQHAFFQLIQQGTKLIPCDFIGFLEPLNKIGDHHKKLIANLFAQTESLAFGKTREELTEERVQEQLIPFKVFKGNRPTNTIIINKLTPFTLGKLISMYEHKIFTQGIIWNIFSFDQWGVELGKTLAKRITAELEKNHTKPLIHDSSTNALIKLFKKQLK